MKKANLLSKAEMKKVMGGGVPVDGCDSSSCPTSQVCCPSWDGSGPIRYSCETPVLLGTDDHTLVCPA